MNISLLKKKILTAFVAASLVLSFGAIAHAADQCSVVNSDDSYVACCTGQTAEDSNACNAYAKTEETGACRNITNDNTYNACCNDNSGDSAICKAYAADDGVDTTSQSVTLPSTGTNAASSGSKSVTLPSTVTGATNNPLNVHLNNPLSGVSTIPDAINTILGIVIRIALPLIILAFIWSGLSFIFARGNPEKMKVAKNMFFYTVIGTMLILGAWVITNAIVGTVNSIVN
jgi:hypothetical protein